MDGNRRILLVTDGMGGHHGGGLASNILVDTIPTQLDALLNSGNVDCASLQQVLDDALRIARREMIARSGESPAYMKMGATLAVGVVHQNVLYFTHVGDCRIYLVRDQRIQPLTKDQTYAQMLADAGAIARHDIPSNPYRHVVMNYVGARKPHQPLEVRCKKLAPGDRIILATDGLTTELDDAAIERIVNQQGHPQDVADSLVYEALHQGSKDNVTVIAVKVVPDTRQT